MNVEIWSDIVCPWCYLGKRRFETALAAFGDADVTIVHRAFQLDPSRPLGQTQNRRQMLQTKYRLSAQQVEEMDAQMEQMAAVEGLEYHLRPEGITGNTRLAHELLHYARTQGRAEAVIERLYRAYFTEGRSVFDEDALVTLGAEVGLDLAAVRQALQAGTYRAAVEAEGEQARQLGATGVPFFVIDQRYGVSGAQPTEVFLDTLRRASESRGGAEAEPR
jgi:predicted DsbA family dithiol-disulfide isomerase